MASFTSLGSSGKVVNMGRKLSKPNVISPGKQPTHLEGGDDKLSRLSLRDVAQHYPLCGLERYLSDSGGGKRAGQRKQQKTGNRKAGERAKDLQLAVHTR